MDLVATSRTNPVFMSMVSTSAGDLMDQFSSPAAEIQNMVTWLRHQNLIHKPVQSGVSDVKDSGHHEATKPPVGFLGLF